MGGSHAHPHVHTSGVPDTWLARLDARTKLVTIAVLIFVAVSTPPEAVAVTGGYFLLLGLLLDAARVPARVVLGHVGTVLPFVGLVAMFLPFLPASPGHGAASLWIGSFHVSVAGLWVFWNVLWKALFGVLCLVLLAGTTSFDKVLLALEQLRVPPVLVMLTSFTHRFAFVLSDELLRMKRARDARGWRARGLWQARTIGHLAGVFFLRSYERSERIYLAMLARGFEGRPPALAVQPLARRDLGLGAGLAGSFLVLRLMAR